jgi:hypothetical protein
LDAPRGWLDRGFPFFRLEDPLIPARTSQLPKESCPSKLIRGRTMSAPETLQRNSMLPRGVRVAGIVIRALFIGILIVVTARVASPQTERFWSAYETPGDLIRMALGFSVCLWLAVHVFILPKDAEAYRTWLYLGLAILPLALLCAVVVW